MHLPPLSAHSTHLALHSITARVECETPNNRLDKFVGKLIVETEDGEPEEETAYSLDNDKLILRVSTTTVY